MTKLTKTQQALIDQAKRRNSDIICVERFSGQGCEGGRVTGGNREMNAALKLERDGLAERVDYSRSAQMMGNGYTVWNSILKLKLKG